MLLGLHFSAVHGDILHVELRVIRAFLLRSELLCRRREVHGLCDDPDNAEGEQHAQVGWKTCPHLQHRDHEDATDAEDQHKNAGLRNLCSSSIRALVVVSATHHLCYQPPVITHCLPPQASQWHNARHKGWQEETRHCFRDRNLALDPKHGGGYIPNRTPSTTCVRSKDRQAAAQLAEVVIISSHVPQDLQSNNCGRQVVDDRTHEEAEQAHDGHKTSPLAANGPMDHASHDVEAPKVINGLNNTHGWQEKKDNTPNILKTLVQVFVKLLAARL
mmetsp:Transcript_148916/g.361577  ORF Transcript_148916/g.361577 Transcript_148916/m.361577 type:complete len:274 (-) Transcript_148916:584-1405(-)